MRYDYCKKLNSDNVQILKPASTVLLGLKSTPFMWSPLKESSLWKVKTKKNKLTNNFTPTIKPYFSLKIYNPVVNYKFTRNRLVYINTIRFNMIYPNTPLIINSYTDFLVLNPFFSFMRYYYNFYTFTSFFLLKSLFKPKSLTSRSFLYRRLSYVPTLITSLRNL